MLVLASPEKASLALYRPRQARKTPLYQLLETYYENVEAVCGKTASKKRSVTGEGSSMPWWLAT